MRRSRTKSLPLTPKTADEAYKILKDPKIQKKYLTTKSGNYFFHDALKVEEDYCMMFVCSEIIEEVERDADWFVDGTFSIVPSVFKQLLTIQMPYKGYVSIIISNMYILLAFSCHIWNMREVVV
jgi:hypothetical protein